MRPALILWPLLLALGACASPALAGEGHSAAHAQDHRVYDEAADARADIDAALARAREAGRRTLVVFGANWCHDSRGLAEHFERPEIAPLIAQHFEVVFVDVGSPQTGQGRNLDLAARFGQGEVVGTPTVVLLGVNGERLNRTDTATAWRNAHSRTPEEVRAELQSFVDFRECYPMPVSAGPGEPFIAPDCSAAPRRP